MDRLAVLLVLILGLAIVRAVANEPAGTKLGIAPLPDTPTKAVTQEYHGTTVTDSYAWLEDAADPVVRQWTEQQNKHTRGVLDQFAGLPALRARVKELLTVESTDFSSLQYRGG